VASTVAPDNGFDPEAEQEVDFARYGRMLARRWWLVAVGVVVGAVVGFLISLGGTKLYSATATIYVGQPYNPGGTSPVYTPQSNPSLIGQIANAQSIDQKAATQCKTTVESFRKRISVQKIATTSTAIKSLAAVNPLVTVTVQAPKGKAAACVANALADAAVAGIGSYPKAKVQNYRAHVAADIAAINKMNAQLADPAVAGTDKLLIQQRLPTFQQDLSTYSGLLLLAKKVESPKVTIRAGSRQVSAQSPRNTVIIAALIGLILGVIGALLWDRVMPRVTARNGS
jgi:capsular polysaccharide biosynthesis protein